MKRKGQSEKPAIEMHTFSTRIAIYEKEKAERQSERERDRKQQPTFQPFAFTY